MSRTRVSLREARTRAGLTVARLSVRACVGRSLIGRLERGFRNPTVNALDCLEHVLRGVGGLRHDERLDCGAWPGFIRSEASS